MSKEQLESLLRQVQQRRTEPRVRTARTAPQTPAAAAAPSAPSQTRAKPTRRRSATPLEQAVSRASGFAPSPAESPSLTRKAKSSEPSFDSPTAKYPSQAAKAMPVKAAKAAPAPKAAPPAKAAPKAAAPQAQKLAIAPVAVASAPIAQSRGEMPAAKTFGELVSRALALRP